jgi:hypothetical protein
MAEEETSTITNLVIIILFLILLGIVYLAARAILKKFGIL